MFGDSGRWADWLIRYRWALLVLALSLTGLAWLSPQVAWTRSVESMFAPDDPLLESYQALKRRFGGNQIVLAVFDDPALFAADGQGLARVREMADRLERIPGVRSVLSLIQLDRLLSLQPAALLQGFGGAEARPLLDADNKLAQGYLEVFSGYTHGADRRTACLVCLLDPQGDLQATISDIRFAVESPAAGWTRGYLAGEPVMVSEGFTLIERDGELLGWVSTLLLGLVMAGLFRGVSSVVVALLIVQVSLLWTRAAAGWLHLRLSLVSSVLSALVTVVGVATVIHVLLRIREETRRGREPGDAMRESLRLLMAPVFWACATDAFGFATLALSHVAPLRDFGWMMGLGSLMVFLATALLIPALAFPRGPAAPPAELGRADAALQQSLRRGLNLVLRRPWTWLSLSTSLALVLAAGSSWLEIETDFTRNFRRDTEIVRAYQWIEDRLSGAGVLDVLVPAPQGATAEFLQRVLRLEDQLRALQDRQGRPLLTKVVSLADAARVAGDDAMLRLLPPAARLAAVHQALPSFGQAMLSDAAGDEPAMLRIMLRAPERQSAADKERLIELVRRTAAAEFSGPSEQPQVTGAFVLLTSLIASLLRDQWICFVAAAIGIVAMMSVAFRSWRLAVIALIPNVLPILITMGCLGWAGVRLNMGAAMISAVSLGLSVDSSIHYLAVYQRVRRLGSDADTALHAAQATVGSAMIYSTLALVAGFLVLCFSQFIPTAYFGALVSLSMAGGLAGNLIVLPLMLHVTRAS